jgi:hypothetical protein
MAVKKKTYAEMLAENKVNNPTTTTTIQNNQEKTPKLSIGGAMKQDAINKIATTKAEDQRTKVLETLIPQGLATPTTPPVSTPPVSTPPVFNADGTVTKDGVNYTKEEWRVAIGFIGGKGSNTPKALAGRAALQSTIPGTPEYFQKQSQLAEQQLMLNPEQQALAGTPYDLSEQQKMNWNIVGQSALKKGSMAAAGGAFAGSMVAPGIGTAVGALAGFVGGTVLGLFEAFEHKNEEGVNFVSQNFEKAKLNIRQAILLANKGGYSELASEQFNNAVTEIYRSQITYKRLSSNVYEWKTQTKDKQTEIEIYLSTTLPMMQNRMSLALVKPDPSYVDYGE